MTVEAACSEACGAAAPAREMYQLFLDTLREEDATAGSVDEANEYPYRAMWWALWGYLDRHHGPGVALPQREAAALAGSEEETAAYTFCVDGGYQEAETIYQGIRN
ncbi:unnamed protein product [Urochloa humidicola]